MSSIEDLYELYKRNPRISTDTRKIEPGCIFVALKGDRFNGNQYAEEALNKGAAYAVIDEPEYNGKDRVLVEDGLAALQELARHHRRQLEIPVIGLTGSNGKTTSKELLRDALAQKFSVYATKGNLNNHIGVPLSILEITDEHEIAVIEMGANHQKEIEFLCTISMPDFGFITNFGKAHLEGFRGVKGVIKGKSELYAWLRNNGGTAFVCSDDKKQMKKSKGIKRITFGEEAGDLRIGPQAQDKFVGVLWEGHSVLTKLTGGYNYRNLAYAVLIARHFGVKDEDIVSGLESYNPTLNRSQYQKGLLNELVVDCYNANPSSMKEAILNMRQFDNPAVILGDMLELGELSGKEHKKVCKLLEAEGIDQAILVGPLFAACKRPKEFLSFASTDEALAYIKKHPFENRTVLLKGSRGVALERLIPFL